MKARGLTIAIVALVVAVAIAAFSTRDDAAKKSRPTSITARTTGQLNWQSTPTLPGRLTNVSHASIVNSGGSIYVALSRSRNKFDVTTVWKLDGKRWIGPVGGRAWKVNTDIETKLASAEGPCVDPTAPNGSVRVFCFSRGKWIPEGGQVYTPTSTSIANGFFSQRGRLFVVRIDIPKPEPVGNVGIGGRAETHLFEYVGGTWIEPHPGDVGVGLDGSQRSVGLDLSGQPCVLFDSTPGKRVSADEISVRVRCPVSEGWKDALPPLTSAGVRAINNDGVALIDNNLYVGADLFGESGVHWDVFAGDKGGWKKTRLGVPSGYWDSQGSIYRIGGDIWSFQFDQHSIAGGYRARIFVRALDPDSGRVVQVGKMLVPPGPIFNLISYGLATDENWVYALYSSPNRKAHTQSVKVSRIRLNS